MNDHNSGFDLEKIANHLLVSLASGMTPPAGSAILWFTGLPASGKTTVSSLVQTRLESENIRSILLDGDEIRRMVCQDLGFSKEDRHTNIERFANLANYLAHNKCIVTVATISPFAELRKMARTINREHQFLEIYCSASVGDCEKRDPKGHYQKARKGEIRQFTGIGSGYEAPENPDILLDTVNSSPENAVRIIMDELLSLKLL